MDITEGMVGHVARLSKLRLGPEEERAMAAELERIVTYMDVLEKLDTEPADPAEPLKNVLRADEVEPSWDRAALLSCAPASDGEHFLVPKAVD